MQVQVHHHDIGVEGLHLLHCLLAVLCYADDLNREEAGRYWLLGVAGSAPTHRREQGMQAAAGTWLVVGDEHSYAHKISSRGLPVEQRMSAFV